jgi:hypothetical protein
MANQMPDTDSCLSYSAISFQLKAFFVLADCCLLTTDCWLIEGATGYPLAGVPGIVT